MRRALLLLALGGLLTACTSPPAPPVARPSSHGPGIGAVPGEPPSGYGHLQSRPPSSGPAAPVAGWWHPHAGMSWQWQLTGAIDTSVNVEVYDLDAFTTPAATVGSLKAAGRHTICYVNAGAKEDFRPDAGRFPASVVGRGLEGWPGEKWLDIRRWDVLEPVLAERFTTCRSKGFDAVEPDNVDGYSNESGFPLTAADQLAYNRKVADLAHRMDLAVGLKNDVEQAATLAPAFDFAVNEECARYQECDNLRVFTAAGKPVFHVEYDLDTGQFCAQAKALGFSSMKKKQALDAWRQPC
jgi:hypothetical protein